MYEIAETFMDSEDYDNAIKFFDRMRRLEDLEDTDRAIVRFKQGLLIIAELVKICGCKIISTACHLSKESSRS